MKKKIQINSREILRHLDLKNFPEFSDRTLVPPHPDLDEKLRQEIKKLRSSKSLMAEKITIRNQKPVGMDDGLIYPGTLYPLGTTAAIAKTGALEKAPLVGTVRIIVILVNFTDKAISKPVQHYKDLFFSLGVVATGSLREYYKEVSHNIIDLQGEVVGPFTLAHDENYYANNNYGWGAAPNARNMAQEAAQLANSAVNYANYDNDSDGYVDAFIVIHAGQGAEVTGNNHDIWSHKWVLPSAYAADGKSVYAYFTVPDDANVGVCAHELGHLLFGFPDLYDTDSSSAGIGNWCLMAGGSWNNGGKTPAHPMAWCKLKQNWVSVSNITANSATPANIKDIKSNYLAYRLWKNGASGNEYFLVENRQKTGFDSYLPAPGLLIWHIDDSIASNSNEAHYKVALEQADGKKDLEHNVNRGDAGDPFPGSSVNRNFKDTTNPNSKSYAGTGTCVEVKEISDPATIMTAKFSVSCIVKPKKEHFKELKKENFKDVKDHQKEIFMDKHYDKIKDKSEKENYEKRIDKVVDGRPGDFGKKNFSLEERILQLEERVNYLAEPFIGQILRPDLSQGAFLNEEGFSPESGETGTIMSGDEKVQFDTK